ncbi:hypothetical protein ACCO45_011809 [Purpureocillium lilacinum]|uniref:Uncharacterized protein n=1 Tax=Purpureocillium lilacinum TaxID=33203 RepID=A0ACC4DCT4_PURLI
MLPRDTHSDEEIDDESQISALPLLARSIPRSERAKGLLPVQLSVRFDVASPSRFGPSARDGETLFIQASNHNGVLSPPQGHVPARSGLPQAM